MFDRQSTTTLHQLLANITNLSSKPTVSLKEHLATYANLWSQLVERTRRAKYTDVNDLPFALMSLAKTKTGKATFLLTSLQLESMANKVDNLQTKVRGVTYEDIYQKLMDVIISMKFARQQPSPSTPGPTPSLNHRAMTCPKSTTTAKITDKYTKVTSCEKAGRNARLERTRRIRPTLPKSLK